MRWRMSDFGVLRRGRFENRYLLNYGEHVVLIIIPVCSIDQLVLNPLQGFEKEGRFACGLAVVGIDRSWACRDADPMRVSHWPFEETRVDWAIASETARLEASETL
jgi:hypothetical protein